MGKRSRTYPPITWLAFIAAVLFCLTWLAIERHSARIATQEQKKKDVEERLAAEKKFEEERAQKLAEKPERDRLRAIVAGKENPSPEEVAAGMELLEKLAEERSKEGAHP